MIKRVFIILLLFSSCRTFTPPPADLVKTPETMFDYLKTSIRCKDFYKAYYVLSKDARKLISYDEFYLGFTNFFLLKRMLLGFEVLELKLNKDSGQITLLNKSAGFKKSFSIKKETDYWVIDLTQDELQELMEIAKKWYKLQIAEFDGRKYIIPPWWKLKPLYSSTP
jgi:hypothetical protein